jgi:hypothetical protein
VKLPRACSVHQEYTANKPDLALLKTAQRVPGLFREIFDTPPRVTGLGAVSAGAMFTCASLVSSKSSAINPYSPRIEQISSLEMKKVCVDLANKVR